MDALAALLDKLEQIRNWFEGQQRYQFFSSSLLLVYEGDLNALTVNGASGDVTNCASNKANNSNVVSYSSLALNDSESILIAARDLKESSNNVSNVPEVNPSGDSNGYVTRLPSYKESVEVTRLMQNGAVNGGECEYRKSSQGKASQREGSSNNGIVGSQEGSKGVTVGQMRAIQRRFQQPGGLYQSTPTSQGYSNKSATNAFQPIVENGVPSAGKNHPLADVKMIDFTHVVDVNTTDENYLVGLRNLIRQLRTLLECHGD